VFIFSLEEFGMRRSLLLIALIVLSLILAACGDKDKPDNTSNNTDSDIGLFDWDRDPNTIIVRLDSQNNLANPAHILNNIPPCTLWGDGRVVWLTRTELGTQEVLEARINETAMRGFLEDIINRGFYIWQDDLVPPSTTDPVIETLTVFLYDEVRTVRRYTNWPQDSYERILENCRKLSDKPVLVLPDAGWVSVYPIPRDTSAPSWLWPTSAPFTLKELIDNGEARWLEGGLATEVWLNAREPRSDIQVLERDGTAYLIAIAVPGISRDASPAPTETGQ
jgi:hypothetical protein